MMSKVNRWFGGVLVVALFGLVNAAALHDIIVGEPDIKNEVIILVVSGVMILLAFALRFAQARWK